MDAFRREQRGVAVGMAAALIVTSAALGAAWALDQAQPPRDLADRLRLALRADILVAACLAAAIANIARMRFFSERDIAGSGDGEGSAAVRQARAVLQNTLEQAVLAVLAHLAVAASFPRCGWTITALVALFVAGRLLFWRGYRHGARHRALGFGLSFYPSIAALLGAGMAVLADPWP